MPEEHRGDIILAHLWTAYLYAFCGGVRHPGLYPGPDHRQFHLRKDTGHLQKCLCHRVELIAPAINGNAPQDFQPQVLALDDDIFKVPAELESLLIYNFDALEGVSTCR